MTFDMARPVCWHCPDEPPLALTVVAEDETWQHRPVVVLVWNCPVCGHGTIDERPREEPQLPLEGGLP